MRPIPTEPCLGLIHQFEGRAGKFEPRRTMDPAGNWEIGWSHKLAGDADPLWIATLDAEQADNLALADLAAAASGVCDAVGQMADQLTDGQYAALIDFAYNVGVAAFAGSTLCHMVRMGNLARAPAEFGKWVYAHVNGRPVLEPGLVRRRQAEMAVFNQNPAQAPKVA